MHNSEPDPRSQELKYQVIIFHCAISIWNCPPLFWVMRLHKVENPSLLVPFGAELLFYITSHFNFRGGGVITNLKSTHSWCAQCRGSFVSWGAPLPPLPFTPPPSHVCLPCNSVLILVIPGSLLQPAHSFLPVLLSEKSGGIPTLGYRALWIPTISDVLTPPHPVRYSCNYGACRWRTGHAFLFLSDIKFSSGHTYMQNQTQTLDKCESVCTAETVR